MRHLVGLGRLARTIVPAGVVCLAAAVSGCASHGPAVPQPFPMAGRPGAAAATDGGQTIPTQPGETPGAGASGAVAGGAIVSGPMASMVAQGIVSTALHLVGTRYRSGGADPDGFDCSGFVQYVFAQQGVMVPRTVEEQAHAGSRVDDNQLRAGDLVFFHTSGRGPTHVGIALDATRFVHAPSARGEVRVEPLARPYWADRFIEARRMIVAPAAPAPATNPQQP
jgi:cell wall-associated NlpC family hydrolase